MKFTVAVLIASIVVFECRAETLSGGSQGLQRSAEAGPQNAAFAGEQAPILGVANWGGNNIYLTITNNHAEIVLGPNGCTHFSIDHWVVDNNRVMTVGIARSDRGVGPGTGIRVGVEAKIDGDQMKLKIGALGGTQKFDLTRDAPKTVPLCTVP